MVLFRKIARTNFVNKIYMNFEFNEIKKYTPKNVHNYIKAYTIKPCQQKHFAKIRQKEKTYLEKT